MSKVDFLRRYLLPCFYPTTNTTIPTTTTTTKKRLSTSLRDDIPDTQDLYQEEEEEDTRTEEIMNNYYPNNPPRSSRTMVIGTFFGHRRGQVYFCIQHDRLNSKPSLLLQLSLPISLLVKEMNCGLVRIALECKNRSDLSSCPLYSIPIWSLCINGRKVGYASKRRATDKDRLILKTMKSMTVGAGVIPPELTPSQGEKEGGELIYMRANYERVIGSVDSESFHLINPDGFPGHELSIFFLRNRC